MMIDGGYPYVVNEQPGTTIRSAPLCGPEQEGPFERSIASAASGLWEGIGRLRGLEERFTQIAVRLGGAEPKVGSTNSQSLREVLPAGERPLVDEVLNAVRDEHDLISRLEQLGRRIHETLGV